jgi:hypothetical protein
MGREVALMGYYTAHLDRDIDRYLNDQDGYIRSCPVCSECEEPIQFGDAIYRIGGERYCQDCIDSFRSICMEDDNDD